MASAFYIASYSEPLPLRVVLEACSAEIPARPPGDSAGVRESHTHPLQSSNDESDDAASGSDEDKAVHGHVEAQLEGGGDASADMWQTVYEDIREEKDKWQVEAATQHCMLTSPLLCRVA
eukprot:1333353-Amphidinium_carterae.4